MLAFGFVAGDFVVRVSDRKAWIDFAEANGIPEESIPDFLGIIDKIEREKPEVLVQKLAAFSLTPEGVRAFIADPANASAAYLAIREDLAARGFADFVELDLSIVRGLAYYTGVVFEVFDAKKSMRAVAGGGRYDTLISTISDGAVDMPATGFAMGDYVIRNLIEETTHTAMQMEVWLQRNAAACDIYVVVADETKRAESLRLVTSLRRAGHFRRSADGQCQGRQAVPKRRKMPVPASPSSSARSIPSSNSRSSPAASRNPATPKPPSTGSPTASSNPTVRCWRKEIEHCNCPNIER